MRIIEYTPIQLIRTDRVPICPQTFAIAQHLFGGGTVPPIHICSLGDGTYRLLDGRHRLQAHKLVGYRYILARYGVTKGYAHLTGGKSVSVWNENPEKYDELIRKGILRWLDSLMYKSGFNTPGEWSEGYEALIEVLQVEPLTRDIYEAMLHHASHEIVKAEQDYFGGLIDHAVEYYKDTVDRPK